jgi:hypothetical protein
MDEFSMRMIYFWSAVVGGGLLVIQVALALLGGDADADADFDGAEIHDGGGGGLSFRTVVAFITFFGLSGMASLKAGVSSFWTLMIALGSGGVAFWLVGLVMFQLSRLKSSGNLDIANAVGVEGKVYLTVPAENSGSGKVTLPIQGRTQEFKAVTRGPAIPTGRMCRVVAVRGGDTLEVETV